jgi:fibronectin type 3 domain-containing protein
LISGCSTKNGLLNPDEPKIDETLEVVSSESVRSISGIKSIAFEWQKVDDIRVNGYNLYRANTSNEGGKLKQVKLIKNRYSTHFVDEDLEPNTKYVYAFSSNGKNDYESKPTKAITISTLDRPEGVSFIQAISNLPKQIKILWRPHTSLNISYYKVQRSTPQTAEWDNLETLKGRLQSEYIDEDLKDNVVYLYRVIAYTFDDVPTYASKIVQAQTKPLPQGVQNLSASNNLPRKIVLKWQPSPNDDIIGHNIYRNDSANGSFDLMKAVSKDTLSHEDFINKDGEIYFYKVTAVDIDNLESSIHKNAVMGSTLEKLNKPILTLAQIQGQKAILNWQKGDSRAVSFNVYKRIKQSTFSSKEEKFTNITDLRFEDNDIVRGVEYNYSIESVDQNGIVSEKTNDTLLVLPKLQGVN